jgi:O-antigen/teichoic acid export membrane protein
VAIADTYKRIRTYLHNSSWILGERLVVLGLGFLGTVLVARYLGPTDFGLLSYALSLATLFAVSGHMGLSGLVVRDLIRHPDVRPETMGTAAILKMTGMGAGFLALVAYGAAFEGIGSGNFYLIVFAGAALLLRPAEVVDFWFQAFLQARYVAYARVSAQLVATALKVTLIASGANLLWFAGVPLLEAFVSAVLLLVLFGRNSPDSARRWRASWERAKALLSQGWVIFLGSIFAVIYLKIDQVMLRWLSELDEVGQYAVAAQFSQAWYFVPTALVASIFPRLIELHRVHEARFYERLQQLFDILFTLGLGVAIVVTLFASWLIELFFGAAYAGSAAILVIHVWSGIFIFMRAAVSRWILIENALYFSLLTQGFGAVANVFLNYLWIPLYGGIGAAYATLLSYSIASFFSLLLYRRTRRVFRLMVKAMAAPIRYPAQYILPSRKR